MKQYFTGFFTAICLILSLFLFVGASSKYKRINTNMISVKGEDGTTLIMDGTIITMNVDGVVTGYFGNNHFKKGTIALFDKKGVFFGTISKESKPFKPASFGQIPSLKD